MIELDELKSEHPIYYAKIIRTIKEYSNKIYYEFKAFNRTSDFFNQRMKNDFDFIQAYCLQYSDSFVSLKCHDIGLEDVPCKYILEDKKLFWAIFIVRLFYALFPEQIALVLIKRYYGTD